MGDRRGCWGDRGCRGQSSVTGIALLLGLTITVASAIVVIGGPVLTDAQSSVSANQAEQAMSQLDSRASTVSLGDSSSQVVRLSRGSDGRVRVDESAGHLEILMVNDTGETVIADERLGAVTYEAGDATLAYQAGGVWRQESGSSTMVSPPEYRYNENTLTFPIVQVTGDPWQGSATTPIRLQDGAFEQVFPSATQRNPIEDGHIHINVTTDYHEGWMSFFETRTDGVVTHDPADNRVSVNLTAPYVEDFDTAVTATAPDRDAVSHDGSPHGGFTNSEVGATRPSASPRVEAAIDDCESNGCQGISGSSFENGTYYASTDVTITDGTYDTSDGAITMVVDGDLEFDGDSHEVVGDGRVTFYVRGDITVSGGTNVNTGGDPSDLHLFVHSDGDQITLNGNPQLTGFVYAPNSSLEIDGGGNPNTDNVRGAVVVERAYANGNGNVEYEPSEGVEFEFDPIDSITFLHISTNEIVVGPTE